jgi:hypothetical protein
MSRGSIFRSVNSPNENLGKLKAVVFTSNLF